MPRLDEAINEVMTSWTTTTILESRERLLPLIQASPINCKVTLVPYDILKASGQLMLSKSSPYRAALDQQYKPDSILQFVIQKPLEIFVVEFLSNKK
jgi:hypothetical protein